ncbi:N-acetylmuramoyl-L-alanine amidase LytC precursor [compost metagenome]
MTRTDDTFVKLEDRAYMSNQLEGDASISIHANTYTDPAISGTETYYYNNESLPFAHEIHKQLLKATGFKDRGVKDEGWMVLKKSNSLAILMEVGYLTNLSNETDMLSEQHQDRVAQGIVQGIKTYFAQN